MPLAGPRIFVPRQLSLPASAVRGLDYTLTVGARP
jgi:hypothetical protein